MFNWLKTWRKRRRLKAMIASGAIFPYWDGEKTRYGDPFLIWRSLTQDEKVNLDRLLPEVDDAQNAAVQTAVDHVCKVFDVRRWDPATQSGLTDLEILNLLGSVLRWTAFVKKNSSPGPTSPPATAPASSTSPAPPSETRNASGDSTSTSTAPKPAAPTPCCEPSVTPSAERP